MSKKRRAKIPPFRVLNSENIFRKFVSKIMRSCDKNFAQLQMTYRNCWHALPPPKMLFQNIERKKSSPCGCPNPRSIAPVSICSSKDLKNPGKAAQHLHPCHHTWTSGASCHTSSLISSAALCLSYPFPPSCFSTPCCLLSACVF